MDIILSRRTFLKGAAVTAAAFAVPVSPFVAEAFAAIPTPPIGLSVQALHIKDAQGEWTVVGAIRDVQTASLYMRDRQEPATLIGSLPSGIADTAHCAEIGLFGGCYDTDLHGAFMAGDATEFAMTPNDVMAIEFSAYVLEVERSSGVDGMITTSLNLSINGPVTTRLI